MLKSKTINQKTNMIQNPMLSTTMDLMSELKAKFEVVIYDNQVQVKAKKLSIDMAVFLILGLLYEEIRTFDFSELKDFEGFKDLIIDTLEKCKEELEKND